jgi:hypothetical protein
MLSRWVLCRTTLPTLRVGLPLTEQLQSCIPACRNGPVVTYQKPSAHMKVEYGFDVDRLPRKLRPMPLTLLASFKPVLERAFKNLFARYVKRIFRYRYGDWQLSPRCCSVIPGMTKVAWHLKG